MIGKVRRRLAGAVVRARGPILASAVTYVAAAALGVGLSTAGWPPAVSQRDSIVAGARSTSILQADREGAHVQAAILDFSANVFAGALPTSIAGLSVVGPFPLAAYRGWVGGIVSIDSSHRSRLLSLGGAIYYLTTMALQLLGYVLTMGAGVYVGLSAWRARGDVTVSSILGLRIPTVAWRDALCLYGLAIPAFLAGSLWEFLAPR